MQSKEIILEINCTYGTGVMLHHNRLIKRKLKNLTSPSDCRLLTAPTIFWWSSLIECDNFNVSISPCFSTSVNTTCDKSAMLTFGGILHRAWDSIASGLQDRRWLPLDFCVLLGRTFTSKCTVCWEGTYSENNKLVFYWPFK